MSINLFGVPDPPPPPISRIAFDPPVRREAPHTSHEAAARIAPHAGTQRATVLDAIRARGVRGATDSELCAELHLTASSINPRRGELAAMGLIVLTGGHRLTPSGRRARVWVATEFVVQRGGGS